MSKFNISKTVLATAMAVVLVPGVAFAAKVVVGPHTKHAFEVTNLTGGLNPTADVNATYSYDLEAGDILIGRSAGNVSVRVTLTGALYNAVAPTVVPLQGSTLVGAPLVSANVLSFVLAPPAAPGFAAGPIFSITAPTLKTTNATVLNTLGGRVESSVDVRDTGTGTTLQSAVNGSVLIATQSSTLVIAAATTSTANVASGKKNFTPGPNNPDANNIKLAGITTNANPLVFPANVSAAGAGAVFVDNIDANLNFQFDAIGAASVTPSARDRLGVQVNFVDTTGFTHVFVTTGTACSAGVVAPVDAAGTTAVLVKTGNQYAGEIDLSNASTESFSVCGRTDGVNPIKNQAVTTSAHYNFLTARDTVLGAAVTTSNIVFDGSSQDVDFFNPSSNVLQQSFLRVSNPTNTTGLVTITGRCDDGTQVTNATFTLLAQHSRLLTAQTLAAGTGLTTALGTCAAGGKLRLNVTGEFSPMKVQNFVKSVISSGEVTTNYNDEK